MRPAVRMSANISDPSDTILCGSLSHKKHYEYDALGSLDECRGHPGEYLHTGGAVDQGPKQHRGQCHPKRIKPTQ